MTIEGSVTFIYETKTVGSPQYHKHFPDIIDDQTITIESPSSELSVYQYFNLFNSFLLAVGFDEMNIMQGATGLAFSDRRKEEDMRKVADDHDLLLQEQHDEIVSELQQKIVSLKAKLSRLENPDNPNYTDEEMDAMSAWNGLVPGSDAAVKHGCKCPVMDNEEMPDDRKWVNGDCPIHGKKS